MSVPRSSVSCLILWWAIHSKLIILHTYTSLTYSRLSHLFIHHAHLISNVTQVQYGIAADPAETAKWDTAIPDDPVLKSNDQWTVTYATAGPDTRTTQLFINYVNNAQLDDQGFAPFAVVTSGFDTALSIVNPTPDSSNGINQAAYTKGGNAWLLDHYPNTTLITKVELIE